MSSVYDVASARAMPWMRRLHVTPILELVVVAAAVAIGAASYGVIASTDASQRLLTPGLVALLLVANLLPWVMVLMLIGRRVARRRAARSPIGGRGQLHVRLVALFSVLAAVPMILVTIFASLLLQYGVEFWSSNRARGMLENATSMVRENYDNELRRVTSETRTMSGDLSGYLAQWPIDSRHFQAGFAFQTLRRNLSEAMIVSRDDPRDPLAVLNPYERPLVNSVSPQMMARIDAGAPFIVVRSRDRIGALVPLHYGSHTYLYAARVFDEALASQLRRGGAIMADYKTLQSRSRTLQLRFNALLLLVSLLIVGLAVLAALTVADRLVRPVAGLVDAARRVAEGDLSARVEAPRREDEIGTLAQAFNQMTGRIEEQTGALESRRALIEAVMSGVSAGVILIGSDRTILIANRSATALLGSGAQSLVGRPLGAVAPASTNCSTARRATRSPRCRLTAARRGRLRSRSPARRPGRS